MNSVTGIIGDKKITNKQIEYIRALAADRDWRTLADGRQIMIIKLSIRTAGLTVDELIKSPLWQQLIFINRVDASATIDSLIKLPKTPPVVTASSATSQQPLSAKDNFIQLINTLPPSKYAIKSIATGEWLFFEIKQNKLGKRWLYKLQGAPGDWVKVYLGYDVYAFSALQSIAKDPWQAAQDYTAEHKECAACGAKLSVGKSIEQGFGPICIKKFKPFM